MTAAWKRALTDVHAPTHSRARTSTDRRALPSAVGLKKGFRMINRAADNSERVSAVDSLDL